MDKLSGKPCIKDTRITVYDILEYLAGGMTINEILDDFPSLTEKDIQMVFDFAKFSRIFLKNIFIFFHFI
ncbi:MAG: DUF433 domain-containing protein [Gammaproteobacteria bacterium]|nr:DUF433 domain-containing protein [Gammaproteobacteria bacterium]